MNDTNHRRKHGAPHRDQAPTRHIIQRTLCGRDGGGGNKNQPQPRPPHVSKDGPSTVTGHDGMQTVWRPRPLACFSAEPGLGIDVTNRTRRSHGHASQALTFPPTLRLPSTPYPNTTTPSSNAKLSTLVACASPHYTAFFCPASFERVF